MGLFNSWQLLISFSPLHSFQLGIFFCPHIERILERYNLTDIKYIIYSTIFQDYTSHYYEFFLAS